MQSDEREFLTRLLETGSPSGYEAAIQAAVRKQVTTFADDVRQDWHGNLIATVNPAGNPRIMLAGHCDQIGLIVNHIDNDGYIRCQTVGGWDMQMLLGQRLQIWTKAGPILGVIARKAIHLLTTEEKNKIPEIHDLWIDIGAKDGKEAKALIEIGDPVTLELGFRELRNNLACAPGMDDKVGVWVVMSALRRVAAEKPQASVVSVSTVQEEIGLRGATTSAFSVDAQLGIAVDVTHATDCPGISESKYGTVKVGAGPVIVRGPNVNPRVFDRLTEIAREHKIPYQVNAVSRAASNDANTMQLSRGGQATAIVAIPNRYMHSPVEIVSLDDLEQAAELIARFCLSLTATCDFTP